MKVLREGQLEASDGEGTLIPLEGTQTSISSDVFIAEDGSAIVGRIARNSMTLEPDRHCGDFKRYISSPQPLIVTPERSYTAEDLAAIVYEYAFSQAKRITGVEQLHVILTCPTDFSDPQRLSLTRAAEQTHGVKVIGIVNEPVAAGTYACKDLQPGQVMVVLDFGGGTFDVSILRWISRAKVDVLAKRGSRDLAGNDIETAMMEAALDRFKAENGIELDFTDLEVRRDISDLSDKIRLMKHELSELERATLSCYLSGRRFIWNLTREEFSRLIGPILENQRQLILQTLDEAGQKPAGIDLVVLAGGTSAIPAIRAMVEDIFQKKATGRGHPQEMVVRGAMLMAPQFMKESGGELADWGGRLPGIEVQEIVQYPLSVAVARSETDLTLIARLMISKGARIPAEVVRDFSPLTKGQEVVRVYVVEAEEGTLIADEMKLDTAISPLCPAGAPRMTTASGFV